MKLLVNSSNGYEIMNRSQQLLTKYLNDEKTHAAVNKKLLKKLNHMNHAINDGELAKAEIARVEPILVCFFILQNAKLRNFELHYNFFFTKLCDVNKFKELEMETDSLYLAFAEKEPEDCIRPQMKAEWEQLWSRGCTDCFTADAVGNFFARMCCNKH